MRSDERVRIPDRVEQAAQQAAAGDLAGALATIDALDSDVAASAAAGILPEPEADRIATAIAAVRADLTALAAPVAPDPAPAQPSGIDTADPYDGADPYDDGADPYDDEPGRSDGGNGGRDPDKGKGKGGGGD